jgi:hypothetical protein
VHERRAKTQVSHLLVHCENKNQEEFEYPFLLQVDLQTCYAYQATSLFTKLHWPELDYSLQLRSVINTSLHHFQSLGQCQACSNDQLILIYGQET